MERTRGIVAIVVTYRSDDVIDGCLRALDRELTAQDCIVVVDNASPDGTAHVARRARARATVVELPRNLGFGAACNRGAALAPEHDVLLVNPDAVVQPGAVAALRSALAADPRRGAVGPRIVRTDGAPEPGCRRSIPSPSVALARLARLDRLFPNSPRFTAYNLLLADPDKPADIDCISGAAMLVRREVWDELRGFDERFFMYAEDIDLCLRIRRQHSTIHYCPEANVVHRKGSSTEKVRLRMRWEFHRSMLMFWRKHYAHGPALLLAPLVAAAAFGRFTVLSLADATGRVSWR